MVDSEQNSPEKNDEYAPTGELTTSACEASTLQVVAAPGGGGDQPDDGGANQDQEDDVAAAHGSGRGRGRGRGRRGRGQGRGTGTRARSPCQRGGERKRKKTAPVQAAAKTIGEVQKLVEDEVQGGSEEEDSPSWNTEAQPPPLSASTSASVVRLSYVTTSPEYQNKLIDLLSSLSPSESPTSGSSSNVLPLDSCAPFARRCAALENAAVMNDFHLMISYMELALHIQWYVASYLWFLVSNFQLMQAQAKADWRQSWLPRASR
jgi:hypothetical protein